jgi:microcystin-dependent protein
MGSPYVGEIRMFAGNFAPNGWMTCEGQLLPISENDVLFQLIGTTYGGDGQETFALPNLASRLPAHMGSTYSIGQTGGVETVTLATTQIPNHSHAPMASTSAATSTTPSGNAWASWRDAQYVPTGTTVPMASPSLTPAGGSQPHDNIPPFLAVNFIISLFGVFPSPT